MKKVLIICDIFPPEFGPRMGYLAKYLNKFGYEAIVISTKMLSRGDHANFGHLKKYPKELYFLDVTEEEAKHKNSQKKLWYLKVKHLLKPEINRSFGLTDKFLVFGDKIIKENEIDVILTSTSSIFPLDVGFILSKRNKIPWVADIRDILEQSPLVKTSFREKVVNLRLILRRNYLIKKADIVSTVSHHHRDVLSCVNINTKTIFNGFDPELFVATPRMKNNYFIITNMGHLTPDGRYDNPLGVFFRATRSFVDEINEDLAKLKIQFFTTEESKKYIIKEAERFGLTSCLEINNFVPADKVPLILNSSSVLLMITSKSSERGPKGILTTELFEYIGVGRPILCVVSDQGEIEHIINSLHRGLAARDEKDISNFLRSKYEEWKNKGFTTIQAGKDISIDIYSREYQAKQFVELFDSLA